MYKIKAKKTPVRIRVKEERRANPEEKAHDSRIQWVIEPTDAIYHPK
jgi:hypothetical protein